MNTTNYIQKNNWNPINELKHEMDRLFTDFWSDSTNTQTTASAWLPTCDVSEDENYYLLNLEMAGVPKEQIAIEVLNHHLIVKGERKFEEKKKEIGLAYSERKYGKFQRSFALPVGLDTEKIEANYEDGVLRILIPKVESAKPKQIKIGAGNHAGFFGKLIGDQAS